MGVFIGIIALILMVQFGYTIILELIDIIQDIFSGLLKWGVTVTIILGIIGYIVEYFNDNKQDKENRNANQNSEKDEKNEYQNSTDAYDNNNSVYDYAYQVLGCSQSDDFETIKQAYHKLAKQYHPDNYYGKPQEFVNLANKKMKAIIDAYEVIKKLKGES